MNEGRLVQVGTPEDLFRDQATTFVAGFLEGSHEFDFPEPWLPIEMVASPSAFRSQMDQRSFFGGFQRSKFVGLRKFVCRVQAGSCPICGQEYPGKAWRTHLVRTD